MSNLLAWARSIKAEGVVRASTGDGRRPFIHAQDIAAVTVRALTTPEHIGECLPITGPEGLTFAEATAKIAAAVGKPLTFQRISDQEAGQRFSATGASEEEIQAHIELWRAIREGRLGTVTNTVERVLGRKPMTFDEWLQENGPAYR
jgi:uncharacterized protein YbjT (DUF2867 family)